MSKSCIVVLGARVTDGKPGSVLASRLDAAADVAAGNDDPIIVSGAGESGAMEQALIDAGIAKQRIVQETHARSTNENLENAWALAAASGVTELIVVTNEFHALRTRLWAWHLGLPIRVHSAPTPWRRRPIDWVREVFATPHSLLRILWRRLRG